MLSQRARASTVRASKAVTGRSSFTIKVVMAGQPTRAVEIRLGTTVRELAALVGVDGSDRVSALVGTGDVVDSSYVLSPDDERLSFVQRLTGAGPA